VLEISPKQLEEVIYFVSHVVLNAGDSSILNYKEVLSEQDARAKFAAICAQIAKDLPEDSADKIKAEQYEAQLKNPKEVFEFHLFSFFINKHTGAEFGIGAEAILRLLQEVDVSKEISKVKRDLKKKTADKSKPLKRLDALTAFKDSDNKPE
jgi:DNA-directed RNA polymerase subunit beta'